ncbi:MAG: helix-turn-helix transcriptional regulator [Dehalococcoidia bacterium]
MQENFIPTGLNFSEPQCHIGSMEPEDIDVKVRELYGIVLRAILDKIKQLGITQEQVGLMCGMEQGTISRYLSGGRGENLPMKTILALAVGLEIDLSRLFDFYNSPQEKIQALLSEINKIVANG